MNRQLKITLIVIATIIVAIGSVAYGAATAPHSSLHKSSSSAPKTMTKKDLAARLKKEQSTILGVLTTAYPKIKTDYSINQGQLFGKGEWYGTTLTYKGTDSMNRDTLRVLMQKKHGVWTLRTTPPVPLLSTVEFPDVPKSVLQEINEPISLPGSDAPPVTAAE